MRIFIVEEDPPYAEVPDNHLSLNPDYEITRFESGKEFLNHLYLNPDLITLDYSLADRSGGEMLKQIKARLPEIPVIIISGQEEVSIAVEYLKMGVYVYFIKADQMKDRFTNALIELKEHQALCEEREPAHDSLKHIVAKAPVIKQNFSLTEKKSSPPANVFVSKEGETGQELMTKTIHYHSERKKYPIYNKYGGHCEGVIGI